MKAPKTILVRLVVSVAAGILLTGASLLVVRGGAYHAATPDQPACPPINNEARCLVITKGGPAYYDPQDKGFPWSVVTIDQAPGDYEQETVHRWGAGGDVVLYGALAYLLLSLRGLAWRPYRKGGAKP